MARGPRGVLGTYQALKDFADIILFFVEKEIRKHGITPAQFYVMNAVKNSDAACQKRLGEQLVNTCGNITVVIKLLEKRKLIRRKKNAQDGRKFSVSLTKHGESILAECGESYKNVLEGIFSSMPVEQLKILRTISTDMFVKLADERLKVIRGSVPNKD